MGLFRKKSWVKSLIKSNEPELKEAAKKVIGHTLKTFVNAWRYNRDPVYRNEVDKERAIIYNKKTGE